MLLLELDNYSQTRAFCTLNFSFLKLKIGLREVILFALVVTCLNYKQIINEQYFVLYFQALFVLIEKNNHLMA